MLLKIGGLVNRTRQDALFDPVILDELNISLIGVGGIGSNVFDILYRLGVGHLTLYDEDVVNSENLPPGNFSMVNTPHTRTFFDRKKVHMAVKATNNALYEDNLVNNLKKNDSKISNSNRIQSVLPIPHNYSGEEISSEIVIVSTDSIESRRLIWQIKKTTDQISSRYWIDCRMGKTIVQIYFIDTESEKAVEFYENSLKITPETLPCGMKSTAPITKMIGAKIGIYIGRLISNIPIPTYTRFDPLNDDIPMVLYIDETTQTIKTIGDNLTTEIINDKIVIKSEDYNPYLKYNRDKELSSFDKNYENTSNKNPNSFDLEIFETSL